MSRLDQIKAKALQAIQRKIKKPQDWGSGFGVTKRRNGETVIGGYRNVYDTGEFYRSLSVYWNGNDLIARFDNDYAIYIIEGYFTVSGKYIPPRDVTELSEELINELVAGQDGEE